jgi:hypothetical protein
MTTKKTDILEDIAGASEKIGIGLLNNHTHYLSGEINEETVGEVVKWLIYENLGSSPNKTLHFTSILLAEICMKLSL